MQLCFQLSNVSQSADLEKKKDFFVVVVRISTERKYIAFFEDLFSIYVTGINLCRLVET